jgi:hypothetical protein
MTDAHALLARHSPRLVYDSQEAYFADSAAIWTDSASNVLKRADGTLLARPPQLALGYLGAHTYADGRTVLADDAIGETTRDYARHAAALHANAAYRNRIHGRARRDSQGRLWLQYWFFYYYNDFQVLFVSGGKHEGDWEMIQIRLDASEKPVEAVFAQHTGAERQDWSFVSKPAGAPDTPLVYVARGSHASYFRAGTHPTSVWFDRADGKGPTIAPALVDLDPVPGWAAWPGFWGDTKATPSPLDSSSPRGPAKHAQWSNPAVLVDTARRTAAARAMAAPPPAAPPAPAVAARRAGSGLVVAYDIGGAPPAALVVTTRPAGSQAPATTYPIEITTPAGEFELPDAAGDDRPLEVSVSTAEPGGVSSASGTTRVEP